MKNKNLIKVTFFVNILTSAGLLLKIGSSMVSMKLKENRFLLVRKEYIKLVTLVDGSGENVRQSKLHNNQPKMKLYIYLYVLYGNGVPRDKKIINKQLSNRH